VAVIELRNTTIRFKDGLSGTGAINEVGNLAAGSSDTDVDTVVLNSDTTTLIPVGARFTLAGETGSPVHTVTARTPASTAPTTNITFTPVTASIVNDDAVITFLPQQIDITVGEGNLTYTETREMTYVLDRGSLDTVRQGNDVPLQLSLDFVYENVTTGTGEAITPVDALKGAGGADEWVSASSDLCEPYAIDVEIVHAPPCGNVEDETTVFPDFRYETLEFDLSAGTISVTGQCNATEPTITRS
jgi:hypothetical protein